MMGGLKTVMAKGGWCLSTKDQMAFSARDLATQYDIWGKVSHLLRGQRFGLALGRVGGVFTIGVTYVWVLHLDRLFSP